jgi:hypothetical protein
VIGGDDLIQSLKRELSECGVGHEQVAPVDPLQTTDPWTVSAATLCQIVPVPDVVVGTSGGCSDVLLQATESIVENCTEEISEVENNILSKAEV